VAALVRKEYVEEEEDPAGPSAADFHGHCGPEIVKIKLDF